MTLDRLTAPVNTVNSDWMCVSSLPKNSQKGIQFCDVVYKACNTERTVYQLHSILQQHLVRVESDIFTSKHSHENIVPV